MVTTIDSPLSLAAAALAKSARKRVFDSREAPASSKTMETMFVPARKDGCSPNAARLRREAAMGRMGFMLMILLWLFPLRLPEIDSPLSVDQERGHYIVTKGEGAGNVRVNLIPERQQHHRGAFGNFGIFVQLGKGQFHRN